ncbi:hypothetical protein PC112_g15110 [Phytophthora cactorum]|nr:hypothetical protein PC112_g15110 [Phytophthora cactorum]KAG3010899.1 hypothetical protein PC120_g14781 [Phytophthora cactorum]
MFGIANAVVARTNIPLERFNREMNAAFKPHPNLLQSSQNETTAPRIPLPQVPDLSHFEVPPDSDTEDDEDEESDISLKSLRCEIEDMLSLSNDLSSDEELANEETGKDLEQEIVTHASVYDFSLDWDGDQESEESSGTDEELPSNNESSYLHM